ncbi:zeta toxin family protein [Paraflavisolibacter sp. H34]|uniref:zeta toxin family protein n=1 Tax=Huijunlia imazamoxiresistens TaxID=3127457 RepID=UPI003016F4E8
MAFNAVVCNSDNCRDFHSKADMIKVKYENEYPAITGPYAHAWTLGLQKYCRERQLHYLLETTLQNGPGVNQTIAAIKRHGYLVELKLMAVNGFLSLLGAYERLEDMRRREGIGRIVSKAEHALRYQALPGPCGKYSRQSCTTGFRYTAGGSLGRDRVGKSYF